MAQVMQYPPGVQPIQQTLAVAKPRRTGKGNCPQCRVGNVRIEHGWVAILLAIFCFPCGILCCRAMKEKRCSFCRAGF